MTASLKSHSVGSTLVLTISNPEHRNALGPELYAAGVEALSVAEGNPDVRSIVITGEGSHFCAGGNLQRLLANRQKPPQVQAESIEGLHNWIETIRACPKPVIAAVEGSCAGAGFSLALACDFVVAAANAVFVMAYSNVGLSPDGGATWGLVQQVSRSGAAVYDGIHLAERLAAMPAGSLASIKELANQWPQRSLREQLARERDGFIENLVSADAGEGLQAFFDKREPRFGGGRG